MDESKPGEVSMKPITMVSLSVLALLMTVGVTPALAKDCVGQYDVIWQTSDTNASEFAVSSRRAIYADTGDCTQRTRALEFVRAKSKQGYEVTLIRRVLGIKEIITSTRKPGLLNLVQRENLKRGIR